VAAGGVGRRGTTPPSRTPPARRRNPPHGIFDLINQPPDLSCRLLPRDEGIVGGARGAVGTGAHQRERWIGRASGADGRGNGRVDDRSRRRAGAGAMSCFVRQPAGLAGLTRLGRGPPGPAARRIVITSRRGRRTRPGAGGPRGLAARRQHLVVLAALRRHRTERIVELYRPETFSIRRPVPGGYRAAGGARRGWSSRTSRNAPATGALALAER